MRLTELPLTVIICLVSFCSCGNDAGQSFFIPQGYELIWSDEFEGSALDAEHWTPETGHGEGGWGNAELQYYTSREENLSVRDGKLVIRAVKESFEGASVTSARIKTQDKFTFTYGYIVASIRLPKTADGLWPAFWMMGNDVSALGWPNCGEIDILEMGHADGIKAGVQEQYFNGACHWGIPCHQYTASHVTNPYSVQDGQFHTYTCIWDEESIRMYLDIEKFPDVSPYFEMSIEDCGDSEFRKPNFFLLNLAVGGNFPAMWDIEKISALDTGSAEMEVDYIRVFQKK
jgi:beta-glucanase (GH16 family)